MVIDDASSCTASAHVDTNVVVKVRPELVMGVCGQLTSRLIRVLSIREV